MSWMIWMWIAIAVISVSGIWSEYLTKTRGLRKGASQRDLEEIRDSLRAIRKRLDDIEEQMADVTLMMSDSRDALPLEDGSRKRVRGE